MILGQVDPDDQALIPLQIRLPSGQWEEHDVVIDTGFSSYLTLPHTRIAALALPFQQRGRYTLGAGSKVVFDIYLATVRWDGTERDVAVLAADGSPLVGMRMLRGYHLFVDVIDGGVVRIEPRP